MTGNLKNQTQSMLIEINVVFFCLVPNNPSVYGFLAGKLLSGDQTTFTLHAYDTNATQYSWTSVPMIEDIDYIYPNEK